MVIGDWSLARPRRLVTCLVTSAMRHGYDCEGSGERALLQSPITNHPSRLGGRRAALRCRAGTARAAVLLDDEVAKKPDFRESRRGAAGDERERARGRRR